MGWRQQEPEADDNDNDDNSNKETWGGRKIYLSIFSSILFTFYLCAFSLYLTIVLIWNGQLRLREVIGGGDGQ